MYLFVLRYISMIIDVRLSWSITGYPGIGAIPCSPLFRRGAAGSVSRFKKQLPAGFRYCCWKANSSWMWWRKRPENEENHTERQDRTMRSTSCSWVFLLIFVLDGSIHLQVYQRSHTCLKFCLRRTYHMIERKHVQMLIFVHGIIHFYMCPWLYTVFSIYIFLHLCIYLSLSLYPFFVHFHLFHHLSIEVCVNPSCTQELPDLPPFGTPGLPWSSAR